MPDFPILFNIDRIIISTASPHSIGVDLNTIGSTSTAAAWPTANKAIFVPFSVHGPVTVVKMFLENGGTVSGNVDVGIYDRGGARLVSSGSTAQSGASAIQEFNITDTLLNPGLYYLACALDITTGQIARWSPSAAIGRGLGVAEQTSAFALPSSATLAALSSGYIPLICATLRATV